MTEFDLRDLDEIPGLDQKVVTIGRKKPPEMPVIVFSWAIALLAILATRKNGLSYHRLLMVAMGQHREQAISAREFDVILSMLENEDRIYKGDNRRFYLR